MLILDIAIGMAFTAIIVAELEVASIKKVHFN